MISPLWRSYLSGCKMHKSPHITLKLSKRCAKTIKNLQDGCWRENNISIHTSYHHIVYDISALNSTFCIARIMGVRVSDRKTWPQQKRVTASKAPLSLVNLVTEDGSFPDLGIHWRSEDISSTPDLNVSTKEEEDVLYQPFLRCYGVVIGGCMAGLKGIRENNAESQFSLLCQHSSPNEGDFPIFDVVCEPSCRCHQVFSFPPKCRHATQTRTPRPLSTSPIFISGAAKGAARKRCAAAYDEVTWSGGNQWSFVMEGILKCVSRFDMWDRSHDPEHVDDDDDDGDDDMMMVMMMMMMMRRRRRRWSWWWWGWCWWWWWWWWRWWRRWWWWGWCWWWWWWGSCPSSCTSSCHWLLPVPRRWLGALAAKSWQNTSWGIQLVQLPPFASRYAWNGNHESPWVAA